MTALTWQTMLLLGLAYFAGCWIACVVRRTIGARSTEMVPATRMAEPLPEEAPRRPPQPVTVARPPLPEPVAVPARDGFRRADTLEPSPEAAAKKPAPAPAPAAPVLPPAAKPPLAPQPQAAAPGAPSATRFERALTGEGTAAPRTANAPVAAPAPAAKPVAADTAPAARQPEAPAPQAAPPQPGPAQAARPPAPPAPAPASAANVQRVAAATGPVASAVTAAAAATQAAPTVRVPAPSAPVPPQPPAKPPVAAAPAVQPAHRPAPGQPPVPAAVAPVPPAAAAAPQVRDDFRRIRAIDAEIANALNRLGVTRYAQIAAWKSEDVARINRELGFKNRVEQENWIEQAQMLARGEETFYSRRLSRGELPRALPAADEGSPKIVSAPASSASPPQPAGTGTAPARPVAPALAPAPGHMQLRAGGETAAAAAAALAAAAASRSASTTQSAVPQAPAAKPAAPATPAGAPASAAQPVVVQRPPVASTPAPSPAPQQVIRPAPAPAPVPVAAAVTPPEVSSRAAFARGTPAAPVPAVTEKTAPQAASSGSVPIISPRPAPAPVENQPARPAVGTARDDLQRIHGVNAEIERLLNAQGITRYGQIARWGSSETERFDRLLGRPGRIAGENWIGQAERLAAGGAPAAPADSTTDAPRSPRLADAIRENQPRADETDPRQPRTSDLTGLRSVRSEALRGESSEAGSLPGARAAGSAPPDDLKRIRGIGVLIEKKLNSMGITSYEQIANWSSGDVDRVSEILDFKGRIERENWVEQARILAAGGQTEFSRRADRGDFYGDR